MKVMHARAFVVGLTLALAAGCAGPTSGGATEYARVESAVTLESGQGDNTVWLLAVTNRNASTLKIAALEWGDAAGKWVAAGGMAEIAHACRQGTTTIAPGETIEFERRQKAKPGMRLTYLLEGSDTRWTSVIGE